MEKLYVHHVKGRLRIRSAQLKQEPEVRQAIVNGLSKKAGIDRIALNAHTGSLLIEYDAKSLRLSLLLATLEEAGIVLKEPLKTSTSQHATPPAWLNTTMSIVWTRLLHELVNALLSATILPKPPPIHSATIPKTRQPSTKKAPSSKPIPMRKK
jgi:hypothetical protein